MRRFSDQWFEALQNPRFDEEWSSEYGPKLPIQPWITYPLHPQLRALMPAFGRPVELLPNELLFPTEEVTGFFYSEKGLTARATSLFTGVEGDGAQALGAPGRFAAGNLNWATHRPAIGRYGTLSHARLLGISHRRMRELTHQRSLEFLQIFLVQLELIGLSDRLAFALLSLAPAEFRFKSLLLAFAVLRAH